MMDENKQSKTDSFELSEVEFSDIYQKIKQYEDPRAASIEALKIVQKHRGWIPDSAIFSIANLLGITTSDLEGVATFYSQIFRQPVGRHVIRYCDSVVCYITGYQNIQTTIEKKLSINSGQTTLDRRFTLLPTCCLGNCDKGPTMMIDNDTYNYLNPELIPSLLEQYK